MLLLLLVSTYTAHALFGFVPPHLVLPSAVLPHDSFLHPLWRIAVLLSGGRACTIPAHRLRTNTRNTKEQWLAVTSVISGGTAPLCPLMVRLVRCHAITRRSRLSRVFMTYPTHDHCLVFFNFLFLCLLCCPPLFDSIWSACCYNVRDVSSLPPHVLMMNLQRAALAFIVQRCSL